MKKVLGIGNALVDVLIHIQDDDFLSRYSLPKGSMQLVNQELADRMLSEIPQERITMVSGGSAANTIHGLARLGVPVAFIGSVGRDKLGDFFRKDMAGENIMPLLAESRHATGKAIAFITPDSERTFATFLGAATQLAPEHLHERVFKDYDYLYVEGYMVQDHRLLLRALSLAQNLKMKIALDLASYNIVSANHSFLWDILTQYVDILFANEQEANALTGLSPEESLEKISEHCWITIIKLGKKGAIARKEGENILSDSLKVTPLDTTGAGDLFASGFMYGHLLGYNLKTCADIGSMLAANVIECIGTKMDESRWENIKKRITQF
jgi:sugar/nucleoside kinase (ribokinase family)